MSEAALDAWRERLPGGLVPAIRDSLGSDLIGLYLYGSATTGGFTDGVSDVDLVAVTRRAAEDLDLAALSDMHARFEVAHPDWRGRIEVAYVGLDDLRAFRTTSRSLAVVSPGEAFHVRDDDLSHWAANWYLVRQLGVVLWGPPVEETMPEVARAEFVAAVIGYAKEVAARDRTRAHPGELAYELLTLARALVLVRTGNAVSKQDAAAWVADLMPDCRDMLEHALAVRRTGGGTGFDGAARRDAEVCVARLNAAIHAAGT